MMIELINVKRKKLYTEKQLNNMLPSRLLRLALVDAKWQDGHGGLEMSDWIIKRTSQDECRACLAGSVLLRSARQSVELTKTYYEYPGRFIAGAQAWMWALNDLRNGLVARAVQHLNAVRSGGKLVVPDHLQDVFVAGYIVDPVGWWPTMRKLARDLKAAGL